MSNNPLAVLGGISAEQFLLNTGRKKPLLVRQAIPEVGSLLEPSDIVELALEEGVTARLLTQHGKQHEQWKLQRSPLSKKDLNRKKLPPFWTLLVQAVDHFSPEVAQLWQAFDFIPQWRRDDIMLSYAPQGGSVGRHFDQYDVFLVQGYGERRWQLGQYCDESTQFIPDQPLRLLPDMDVFFDEILYPGDLLYVPPKLSHYGVAENDCLTYSFGFRMPNNAQLLDQLTDQLLHDAHIQTPITDLNHRQQQAAGEVNAVDIESLKKQLIEKIENTSYFDNALLSILSESKYPDSLPQNDALSPDELAELLEQGARIIREPAARLIYTQSDVGLTFWALGEALKCRPDQQPLLKTLADGGYLDMGTIEGVEDNLELICRLYADSILFIDDAMPD